MITYMQNSHLRNRRAAIDMSSEVLRECIPVLLDAGFNIVGSATSRGLPHDCVRLIIEGDALPQQCDGSHGMLLVRVIIVSEQYGRQRLARVDQVELVNEAEAIAS